MDSNEQSRQVRSKKDSFERGFLLVAVFAALALSAASVAKQDPRHVCFGLGMVLVFMFLNFNRWMLSQRFGDPEFESHRIERPLFFVIGVSICSLSFVLF